MPRRPVLREVRRGPLRVQRISGTGLPLPHGAARVSLACDGNYRPGRRPTTPFTEWLRRLRQCNSRRAKLDAFLGAMFALHR
jgi:hypothetical protein